MPNFWSRGWQYFEEKLGGQITEDKDFENNLKKIEKIEKGLHSFKTVIQNFNSYIEKFCSFFVDLNNALNLIYENSPYYIFIEEFICKQQIINTHFEGLSKLLIKLYSRTSEWDRIFQSVKSQLEERENKRKIYDHYEKKLLKIHKSSKDKKYIERNEEKYTKAASDYIAFSEKIYNLMQNSLKLSWKLANPLISELIVGEQKLFQQISSSLSCFKDSIKRFSEIDYNLNNPNSKAEMYNYDPLKYMKEKDMIKKISVRRMSYDIVPIKEEERKKKYSFWGLGNEKTKKIEDKNINNLNNVYSQSRITNSFGKISESKLEEFLSMEDDLQ